MLTYLQDLDAMAWRVGWIPCVIEIKSSIKKLLFPDLMFSNISALASSLVYACSFEECGLRPIQEQIENKLYI